MDPRIALLVAASLALSACSVRYDVRTDFDPEADFARFHSYAFAPRPKQDTPDILDNSLVRKRLEGMFRAHLAAHGLAPAAPDAADLVVRYWVTSEQKTEVSAVPASPFMYGPAPYGYGYPGPYWGGRWGSMYDDVIVRDYTEGTLVLDLVDRAKDELVWRAYVIGTLHRDRETVYQLVDEALARAFRELPPTAGVR